MTPMLTARGLKKHFGGVTALAGVDLDVGDGELVALIGPNGAGKSTCFNIIGGQLAADGGRVRLAGADITGLAPRAIWRRGVGRTFQITATFASMSVLDNVQTVLLSARRRLLSLRPGVARAALDAAYALLERVGIAGEAERPCSTLSYGDLKRVELAMALANRPRLLLMDEPTAGMAPAERRQLMALVDDIAKADGAGIGVLFTEHDMDVVFGHADRVLVLDRGVLVAMGTPSEVRASRTVQDVYLGEAGADGQGGGAAGRR